MILRNQRYYIIVYSKYWGDIVFHLLDHITNKKITSLKNVKGYENGIIIKNLHLICLTCTQMHALRKTDIENKVSVNIKASPNAMEHWAMQYINHVKIILTESLRTRVKVALENGLKKYK